MIIVCGFNVHVAKWDDDQGALDECAHWRGDDTPGPLFADLDSLNKCLADRCLPDIGSWEPCPGHGGVFTTSRMEDKNGSPDENGGYLVDYWISVREGEPSPLKF